jgi:hypothetical protein
MNESDFCTYSPEPDDILWLSCGAVVVETDHLFRQNIARIVINIKIIPQGIAQIKNGDAVVG